MAAATFLGGHFLIATLYGQKVAILDQCAFVGNGAPIHQRVSFYLTEPQQFSEFMTSICYWPFSRTCVTFGRYSFTQRDGIRRLIVPEWLWFFSDTVTRQNILYLFWMQCEISSAITRKTHGFSCDMRFSYIAVFGSTKTHGKRETIVTTPTHATLD